MDRRKLVMVGLFIGSSVGGFVPSLWGAGALSFSGLIFGAAGGLAGIWLGFKLGS